MIMPSATPTARIPVVKARQSRAGDFKSRASVMFTSVEISPSFAFHRDFESTSEMRSQLLTGSASICKSRSKRCKTEHLWRLAAVQGIL
ncbi:hypothetical protein HNR29_004473 [Rhizobium leguminosarum]|nr:hypothetical protein [Rhizobium leguminosarum]